MRQPALQKQVAINPLLMPDQDLHTPFVDDLPPDRTPRIIPRARRLVLLGLPLLFSSVVVLILTTASQSDGFLTTYEIILIALMAALSGWESLSSTNAIIGLLAAEAPPQSKNERPMTVAFLATIRDENPSDVILSKLELLRVLQSSSGHRFALHVLSDSTSSVQVAVEQHLVSKAWPLPVVHHHRTQNIDFKSGNIRDWITRYGADYDAFIILDADSEMDHHTVNMLVDALACAPTCGLIQTVPVVLPGTTRWQHMQSVASEYYGSLQGKGFAAWMGDEANYYGHNAIVRTQAFAACAGLPHLEGRGLWNGTILSHDFVEAALLRRAGWAVRLMPSAKGSFEQAPSDVIAHLKRDLRWCLGNFQHSRLLGVAGFYPISRLHLLSGIFTYLSSAMWLATLLLWALLDNSKTGVEGKLAVLAFLLIATNLLFPRILGVFEAMQRKPDQSWAISKAVLSETFFSSLFAPSLMLQRVRIIGNVISNRKPRWAPIGNLHLDPIDFCTFHSIEILSGLGLLACIERGILSLWFLPLAACLALTPLLSWFAAQPTEAAHTKN